MSVFPTVIEHRSNDPRANLGVELNHGLPGAVLVASDTLARSSTRFHVDRNYSPRKLITTRNKARFLLVNRMIR